MGGMGEGVSPDQRLEYLKTIKLAKKDNMTPNNCYVCQLSQIPGVSIDMADVIANQYPSMLHLVQAYQRSDDQPNMLAELVLPIANHKTRRLGNVISVRIHQYICPIDQPDVPVATVGKIVLKLKNN